MKYKAVIFDLFGTLIDNFTRREYDAMLLEIAGILKAPPADFTKAWKASFGERVTGAHPDQRQSFISICRELKIQASPEQIERAFNARMEFARRTTVPRRDAVKTLTSLRKDGYKTGLISDCTGEIPLIWDETPLTRLFDAKIFSCVVHITKPDPRMYRMAADELKVKPGDCLYIGDGSSQELTGALKAGMHPICIRDPNDEDEEHFLVREDDWDGPRISSLTEVLELVNIQRTSD
jgi:putative hydrolase of the HAD superfamily